MASGGTPVSGGADVAFLAGLVSTARLGAQALEQCHGDYVAASSAGNATKTAVAHELLASQALHVQRVFALLADVLQPPREGRRTWTTPTPGESWRKGGFSSGVGLSPGASAFTPAPVERSKKSAAQRRRKTEKRRLLRQAARAAKHQGGSRAPPQATTVDSEQGTRMSVDPPADELDGSELMVALRARLDTLPQEHPLRGYFSKYHQSVVRLAENVDSTPETRGSRELLVRFIRGEVDPALYQDFVDRALHDQHLPPSPRPGASVPQAKASVSKSGTSGLRAGFFGG